ncbi:hypothetical protein TCAL_02574 [Tigriopus californicus]|uniref:Beclin 1-associated autophagy-related key regulator n=1 Tax=Tigriopus californicus TaxID=6832 RepID=A0A553P833_TIGCA|nr:uncharacterized protein LOC131877299 [Tigriopus californicus]XP_059078892.1 uncharacterized protein LOC131877299 [Tigriopus californicus]TRY73810.1 hypothetical protein TCAL_02574 [Tigriopus californicus]|eukprot:TCALIF_02574-PA protein Name:"Similar to ATG14 Beclin 1-associated autophagy-related key regulator (Homo sapiens)" AED:0.20 eAED:0.20 QI:0/-1/0/1/-1/1/1/0/525
MASADSDEGAPLLSPLEVPYYDDTVAYHDGFWQHEDTALSVAPPNLQTVAMDSSESSDFPTPLAPPRVPCFACQHRRNIFICTSCLQSGQFEHSRDRQPESMADKQVRDAGLTRSITDMRTRVLQSMNVRVRRQLMLEKIRWHKTNIRSLEKAVADKRDQWTVTSGLAQKIELGNGRRRSRFDLFERKVEQIRRCSLGYRNELKQRERQVADLASTLAAHRQKYIRDLSAHIFPISEIFPSQVVTHCYSDDEDDNQECLIMESLNEAMSTSFINGRWVDNTPHSNEMHYRIVESCLSSSGDYVEYFGWKDKPEAEVMARHDEGQMNPTLVISSALMLTTQLTHLIATTLDLILPKKMRSSDFGLLMKSEYRFTKRLLQLNFNIAYLCVTQGINPEYLKPKQTLHNLKLLIDFTEVGGIQFGRPDQRMTNFDPLLRIHYDLLQDLERRKSLDDGPEDSDEEDGISAHLGLEDEDWESINRNETILPGDHLTLRSPSPPSYGLPLASHLWSSLFRGQPPHPTSPRHN